MSNYKPKKFIKLPEPNLELISKNLETISRSCKRKLFCLRTCGKIHQEISNFLKHNVRPGHKIIDIVNTIEDSVKVLTKYDKKNPLKSGPAFPTGININNCVAHWTPEKNNKFIIRRNDVCKIDFGVQMDGYIIDAAITLNFNPKANNLVKCCQEAIKKGLSLAGPDAILSEIGRDIGEIIDSYDYKTYRDLTGHRIDRYKIHGKKVLPNFYFKEYKQRMEEGEVYAIEPYITNGKGILESKDNISHYMVNYFKKPQLKLSSKEKIVFNIIKKKYNTLAFCNRWLSVSKPSSSQGLHHIGLNNHKDILYSLVKKDYLSAFPPIYDVKKKSQCVQFEKTFCVKNNGIEIF